MNQPGNTQYPENTAGFHRPLNQQKVSHGTPQRSAHGDGSLRESSPLLARELRAPAPLNPAPRAQHIGGRLLGALTQAGLCYRRQDDSLYEVRFSNVQVFRHTERAWVAYEVDMQRLPPRITADDLISQRMVHHLSSVCGSRVHVGNTTGVTYIVALHEDKPAETISSRLPKLVPFTLDDKPDQPYNIPIGVGHNGPIWTSLDGVGHVLVGGATRSGKTSFLHASIAALCLGQSPEQLKLALIDPKGNEFTLWREVPHLLSPIATTVEDADRVVARLVQEMDRRGTAFSQAVVRSLHGYNSYARRCNVPTMPLIILVVDEFVDLALQAGANSGLQRNLARLASKGAGLGITLILATQNPKADVINTLVRGNCAIRIAFSVPEAQQSRTILDSSGAEQIPSSLKGRLLARLPDAAAYASRSAGANNRHIEVQGMYVSDEQLGHITRGLSTKTNEHSAPEAGPIDETLRELVMYAAETLDGKFAVNQLFEGLQRKHRKHVIAAIAQQLELQGLLTRPVSVTDSRRITPALAAQCGLSND